MPKIKHIGISTNDPGACADFYINAFGLTEVERSPDNDSAILSDGYINVTILKFKYEPLRGRLPWPAPLRPTGRRPGPVSGADRG